MEIAVGDGFLWSVLVGGIVTALVSFIMFRRFLASRPRAATRGDCSTEPASEFRPLSTQLLAVHQPHDTVVAEAASTSRIPTLNPQRPRPRCSLCGEVLPDESRVSDDLFRCPNCRMLTDTAPPPPPPPLPQSQSGIRRLGSSSHGKS